MDGKDVLRLVVMAVWTMMCLLAAIQGFNGVLAPWAAGFGWIIVCVFNAVLIIAYWRISKFVKNKLLEELIKMEAERISKEKNSE